MKYHASRVTLLGLLFALSMVLSLVEASFSGLIPIPGIKLGLSNIVTMYCLFCLGKKQAYSLAFLKALFVLLTRGAVSAAMSFAGGIVSITIMLILRILGRGRFSQTFLSVIGAFSHNIGQLAMAAVVLQTGTVFYYLPILAGSGVVMGVLTGLLFEKLTPHLDKIFF